MRVIEKLWVWGFYTKCVGFGGRSAYVLRAWGNDEHFKARSFEELALWVRGALEIAEERQRGSLSKRASCWRSEGMKDIAVIA